MKNISKILILGHSSFLALEIKNFLIDKKIQIITLEKKFDINENKQNLKCLENCSNK